MCARKTCNLQNWIARLTSDAKRLKLSLPDGIVDFIFPLAVTKYLDADGKRRVTYFANEVPEFNPQAEELFSVWKTFQCRVLGMVCESYRFLSPIDTVVFYCYNFSKNWKSL